MQLLHLCPPPCRKRGKGSHGSGERPQCGASQPAAAPGSGDNRPHAAVDGGALSGRNEEVFSTDDDVKTCPHLFLTFQQKSRPTHSDLPVGMCLLYTHCHRV